MELREPASFTVGVPEGQLAGASGRYVKRLCDLEGLYGNASAFDEALQRNGDRIVYEVTEFRPTESSGDLIFGVTRMEPGRIGDEFFLTRGHIHARADRPEIYYGEAGHGIMLMESPAGETRAIEIRPRSICYVPAYWIHRSVNVGHDQLVMTFCYPSDAGQDYAIIARSGGMRHRVVADSAGGWALVENGGYRPRSGSEIAAIMA
jgi:glucose-6-phosphate isomerase, archaeal